MAPQRGWLPDVFVAKVISSHIERELGGKLEMIAKRYRAGRSAAE